MKRATLLTVFIIISVNIFAQSYQFENGLCELPYQERFFAQDKGGKSMLAIYLHPKSARGHKNDTQEKTYGFQAITHYLDSIQEKAIFLAPQCEECRHWNEYSSPIGKFYSEVVKDFIIDYATKHDIDMNRIYVLGESFGGSGVWRLVSDYPTLFAAAMPAVCNPKLNKLEKYVNLNRAASTPLCVIIGEYDEVYGPAVMKPHIEKLQKKGCDLNYIIMPAMNHRKICANAYPVEALDWLFKHKK